MNGIHSFRYNANSMRGDNPSSPRGFFRHKSMDGCFPNLSSPLSRSGSLKSPSRKLSFRKRNTSQKRTDSRHGLSASLSRNASRKNASTIMFSNSMGKMKPPAIERPLECTLEELCYGCMKKIEITRDVIITNTGSVPRSRVHRLLLRFFHLNFDCSLLDNMIYYQIRFRNCNSSCFGC